DLYRYGHPERYLFGDGLARPQRLAEIQAREPDHVVDKLLVERLVEAQALAPGPDCLLRDGGTGGPEVHPPPVAWHHPDQEEYGDGHPNQGWDHQKQSAKEVPEHAKLPAGRRRGRIAPPPSCTTG